MCSFLRDDLLCYFLAFFANVYQETGGGWESAPGGYEAWGLCFCEEQGFSDASVGGYAMSNDQNYQAVAGKSMIFSRKLNNIV